MALQGTLVLFDAFSENIGNGTFDLTSAGHVFKVALIDDTLVALNTDTTPDITDYTQVAGGNGYTTDGEVITCTWTRSGSTATFAVTSGATTWLQNGSGPINIFQALIYDTDVAATDDAIGYIEMTEDNGVTPISLVAGDITITWAANIFTVS